MNNGCNVKHFGYLEKRNLKNGWIQSISSTDQLKDDHGDQDVMSFGKILGLNIDSVIEWINTAEISKYKVTSSL